VPRKQPNPRVLFKSDDSEESVWVRQFLQENGLPFVELRTEGMLTHGPVVIGLSSADRRPRERFEEAVDLPNQGPDQ
jgi:hypothetical protein